MSNYFYRRIRLKGLLRDAERDVLATAKLLVRPITFFCTVTTIVKVKDKGKRIYIVLFL